MVPSGGSRWPHARGPCGPASNVVGPGSVPSPRPLAYPAGQMDPMVALVPVRLAPPAKLRLAHVLSPAERNALVERLFRHVTGALEEAGLDVVALAAGGRPTAPGVEVWEDLGTGLNRGLSWALHRLGGRALVVPADLPWVTAKDVRTLLGEPGDLVVARALDGGTNGLVLRRPGPTPTFGTRSALAHADGGRRAGLHTRVVDLPAFRQDLDDEAALRRSASSPALAGLALGP